MRPAGRWSWRAAEQIYREGEWPACGRKCPARLVGGAEILGYVFVPWWLCVRSADGFRSLLAELYKRAGKEHRVQKQIVANQRFEEAVKAVEARAAACGS